MDSGAVSDTLFGSLAFAATLAALIGYNYCDTIPAAEMILKSHVNAQSFSKAKI